MNALADKRGCFYCFLFSYVYLSIEKDELK